MGPGAGARIGDVGADGPAGAAGGLRGGGGVLDDGVEDDPHPLEPVGRRPRLRVRIRVRTRRETLRDLGNVRPRAPPAHQAPRRLLIPVPALGERPAVRQVQAAILDRDPVGPRPRAVRP